MDKLQKARKEIAGLKAGFNKLISSVDCRTARSGFWWDKTVSALNVECIKARVETATTLGFETHVTVKDGAVHFDYVKKVETPCYV